MNRDVGVVVFDEIGSLDGPEPLGTVTLLDEQSPARTVAAQAVVDRLNSGYYEGRALRMAENPVVLLGSDGTQVGFATLSVDKDELKADLFFEYASPDRLTLETNSYPLRACAVVADGEDWVYVLGVALVTYDSLEDDVPPVKLA